MTENLDPAGLKEFLHALMIQGKVVEKQQQQLANILATSAVLPDAPACFYGTSRSTPHAIAHYKTNYFETFFYSGTCSVTPAPLDTGATVNFTDQTLADELQIELILLLFPFPMKGLHGQLIGGGNNTHLFFTFYVENKILRWSPYCHQSYQKLPSTLP